MSGFSETLRRIRFERRMTQEEFAQLLGTSKQNISRYENGEVSPKISTAEAIAERLGMTLSELNGGPRTRDAQANVQARPIRVPVLGTIPAGVPLEAIEDVLDWEELPAAMARGGKEYFGLKVSGDSMLPDYRDGDVLILRKRDTCESGQDCAVMVNSDDATFKRVRISEKGITLMPLNPAYEPLFYSNQEVSELPVRIIGVVVELRRKV